MIWFIVLQVYLGNYLEKTEIGGNGSEENNLETAVIQRNSSSLGICDNGRDGETQIWPVEPLRFTLILNTGNEDIHYYGLGLEQRVRKFMFRAEACVWFTDRRVRDKAPWSILEPHLKDLVHKTKNSLISGHKHHVQSYRKSHWREEKLSHC